MTFQESIGVCFRKYADFNGTATRSEYWWFFLFVVLGQAVASVLRFRAAPDGTTLFSLLTILPLLAVGSRRLHETRRSGWLQLLGLVPVAGFVVVLIFLAQPAKQEAVAAS
jgi:uncharacterized membrane protein YhaH (DUF805 family)